MDKLFELDSYISNIESNDVNETSFSYTPVLLNRKSEFETLCDNIRSTFTKEWENDVSGFETILERQKRAIIGYEREVDYFKDKIDDYLKQNHLKESWYPTWYNNITDAVFQENWGVAGLAEWISGNSSELEGSSSAKIIGERIYFLVGGVLELQPQTINRNRRKQLRKALLLKTPKKRLDNDYHEVYMLNGIRITIYGEGKTKEGQDTIVFRKFFVKDYTFEKQVALGSIPEASVPLFKAMINTGFNVVFTGAVRTAKTTFLTTWQSYEDPRLEGVSVETDPEIPFHLIMPEAPILQLVADGEDLERVVKSIMRSDADYIILGEARDGVALNIAVKIANKGTKRVKMTYHCSDTIDFCYDVADEIVKTYGGSLYSTILKVSRSFQFVFQFIQLKDKSKKRLKSIFEIQYDPLTHEVVMQRICRYRHETDDWVWNDQLSSGTIEFGNAENQEAMKDVTRILSRLKKDHPDEDKSSFAPAYEHLKAGKI